MTFYLTVQGRCDNLARLEEYRAQQRKLAEERDGMMLHATDSDPEAGQPGDHLEIDRQKTVLIQQIARIEDILANSAIAEVPTSTERLRIEHVATIQRWDLDKDERIGKPERYKIVGHQEGDPKANPPSLSYDAPLIEKLLGRTVDPDRDPEPVILGGKRIGVELLKIELPTAVNVDLRLVG